MSTCIAAPSIDLYPSATGIARCRVCGRVVTAFRPVCFCCRVVAMQLGLPLVPIVAMTEYRVGDRAHWRLRAYKDAPSMEVRARARRQLADALSRWLDDGARSAVLSLDPWNAVTPVPSSHRAGPSPVGNLVESVPGLAVHYRPLLIRGSVAATHLQAHRAAFALAQGADRESLAGVSVLVIDDTTTTGAAIQSAAAALRLAGARVVGAVALGRALPPRTPSSRC